MLRTVNQNKLFFYYNNFFLELGGGKVVLEKYKNVR